MAFSVNTNIASLQAHSYLRMSSDFQSKTINRVTSGLRIVGSSDDAAGLAIANALRSDQAVLGQGVRNANDGLATLQTIDGGISNISALLDRARTLATQSASDTFTGDRTVLNNEFQSVMTEIDRQSQAIGLDTSGTFAKNLSVFIGGGRTNGSDAISNGSVGVDLRSSTVDTKSLGLKGLAATGSTTDIGTGSSTSVVNILADATNVATETVSGYTAFYFTGPGFADTKGSNRVSISVNLTGVTDVTTLAAAINSAITTTGNGVTQQATAFKNAGITASVKVDANGSHLQFNAASTAFQVEAGDMMANALLGNIASGTTGKSVNSATATTTNTAVVIASATSAENNVKVKVSLGGTSYTATLNIANADARATIVSKLNTALTAAGANVTASVDGSNKLLFTANNTNQAQSLNVQVSGDTKQFLGVGSFQTDASNNFDYTTLVATATAVNGESQNIQISVGDKVVNLGALAAVTSEAANITTLNTAIQANTTLAAAGIVAQDDGTGKIQFVSNGTKFRVNSYGATGTGVGFGFANAAGGVDSAAIGSLVGSYSAAPTVNAGGSYSTGFFSFSKVAVTGVTQSVTVVSPDSSGVDHSIGFSLTSTTGADIDTAIATINSQLQTSNDTTLQKIVAVKEQSSGVEGIRFISTLSKFSVSLGTTSTGQASAAAISGISNGTGTSSQGVAPVSSAAFGTGTTAGISNQADAKTAVTAVIAAVTSLGAAQAVVGKGQNQFNYAINLAQSQLTNLAAAESRIRDADLAVEAANLSKAQILIQAGTAALAQANSAPQAILALLRG